MLGGQTEDLQELATNKTDKDYGEGHKKIKTVAEVISFPYWGGEKTKRNRKATRRLCKGREGKHKLKEEGRGGDGNRNSKAKNEQYSGVEFISTPQRNPR